MMGVTILFGRAIEVSIPLFKALNHQFSMWELCVCFEYVGDEQGVLWEGLVRCYMECIL